MTPRPHDVVDLRLAPVALQLDQRLEDLGRLSPRDLLLRVALDSNHLLDSRRDRERALLHTVTRWIDLGGWSCAWDDRGLRLSHGQHTLVLGVPGSLLVFLSAGAPSTEVMSAEVIGTEVTSSVP